MNISRWLGVLSIKVLTSRGTTTGKLLVDWIHSITKDIVVRFAKLSDIWLEKWPALAMQATYKQCLRKTRLSWQM